MHISKIEVFSFMRMFGWLSGAKRWQTELDPGLLGAVSPVSCSSNEQPKRIVAIATLAFTRKSKTANLERKKRTNYFPTLDYAPVPENKNVRFSRMHVSMSRTLPLYQTIVLPFGFFEMSVGAGAAPPHGR